MGRPTLMHGGDGLPFGAMIDGAWSGGGRALISNLLLASEMYPEVLSCSSRETTVVVARNWAPPRRLASGEFVLMPQNAWPWSGEWRGVAAGSRRGALRAASEVSMHRARGVIRIGSAVPSIGRQLGAPLGNVLDKGFESALAQSRGHARLVSGPHFVSIGSLTTYRGVRTLLAGYAEYKRQGGSYGLAIAGPKGRSVQLTEFDGVQWLPVALERPAVLGALRHAAGAVFPSTVEASPVTVLEADACSAEVIVSDIPGHRETCGRARVFASGQAEELAARLVEVEDRHGTGAPEPCDPALVQRRVRMRQDWAAGLIARLRRCHEDRR